MPDLTVNYTIIDKSTGKEVEGGTATSGTFMQMNASDGPHYGANVKLDKAGTYQLKLSIESPASKVGCCTLTRRPASRATSGPSRSRSPSTTGITLLASGD